MLVLYNYVRQHKPKEILECGTGVSTIPMAFALMENERDFNYCGRITSMEEHEEWYNIAQTQLPFELKKYVEIILSPKVEDYYYLFRGVKYKQVPDRKYDFVFVDGPTTSSPIDGQKTFDFDFINVVRRSSEPVFGIIDCRKSTAYVLNKILGGKVRVDYVRNMSYIGQCTKHDLLSTNEFIGLKIK